MISFQKIILSKYHVLAELCFSVLCDAFLLKSVISQAITELWHTSFSPKEQLVGKNAAI